MKEVPRRTLLDLLVVAILLSPGCGESSKPGPGDSAKGQQPPTSLVEVLRQELATVLKVKADTISLDVPIAQIKPTVKELDFVEMIDAVEKRLEKEIPDTLILKAAGAPRFSKAMENLSLKQLSEIIAAK